MTFDKLAYDKNYRETHKAQKKLQNARYQLKLKYERLHPEEPPVQPLTRKEARIALKKAKCAARRVTAKAKKDKLYYKRLKIKRTQTLRDIITAQREIYKNLRAADNRLKHALDVYDEPRNTRDTLKFAEGFRLGQETEKRAQAETQRSEKDSKL